MAHIASNALVPTSRYHRASNFLLLLMTGAVSRIEMCTYPLRCEFCRNQLHVGREI